jgi:hypothetical protein
LKLIHDDSIGTTTKMLNSPKFDRGFAMTKSLVQRIKIHRYSCLHPIVGNICWKLQSLKDATGKRLWEKTSVKWSRKAHLWNPSRNLGIPRKTQLRRHRRQTQPSSSRHICLSKESFFYITPLYPHPVGLPDPFA